MKKYILKKGNHYAGLIPIPIPTLTFGKYNFEIDVIFLTSTVYESFNDVDDYDINKLYGISWGYHQTNSFRIGWRSNFNNGIILSTYYYINGERMYEDICTINTNTRYNIKFDKGKVIISENDEIIVERFINGLNYKLFGYKLHPYFGGNKVAPNDMVIYIEEIK